MSPDERAAAIMNVQRTVEAAAQSGLDAATVSDIHNQLTKVAAEIASAIREAEASARKDEVLKRASDLMSKSDKQMDVLLIAVGNELLGGYPRNSVMFQLGHVVARAGDVIKTQDRHFASAIREAQASARNEALEEARDNLAQLAIHLEHAMDSLTDAERTPSVIGGYVRDWAANSLKSKG